MAGIQDFIKLASTNLSVNEKTARSATGALLGVIQQKLAVSDFQNLMSALPGAESLVGTAPSGASGKGGGLLGGLMKAAGGALGGKLGTAVGLAAAMQGTGLDAGQIGGFVAQFISFAKRNVSPDLLARILEAVPELKKKVAV